jgi:drug/metabolite transporter (DMT)-like permease
MTLILLAGGGIRLEGPHMAGILAGTASGMAYAFLIILSRKLSRMMMHHKAVITLLWITVALTAPAVIASEHQLNQGKVLLLITAGLVHSTIAPLLYFSALRMVMAQHAAILGYLEPLAAIPLAIILLGEMPTYLSLGGGFLIMVSAFLVIHDATRKRDAHQ